MAPAAALALLLTSCFGAGDSNRTDPTQPDAALVAGETAPPTSNTSSTTSTLQTTSTTAPPPSTTTTTTTTMTTTTTTTEPPRSPGTVPASTVGVAWGTVEGLTMFRGNPTRTYYGSGPVPASPQELWRFPESPMCGTSPVGGQQKVWCGSGWTGQPVVWERPDGVTEIIFGAYDKHIHFLDASTGVRTRPDFPMGDIIKGSVTLDPDGYPLLYSGSRDPRFRIIALDRDTPTELWSLDAASVAGMWNNDWDSNPIVIDDMLYVGGENSWWFAIRLNRGRNADGHVSVDPEVVFAVPAFTDELLRAVGRQQSVESSTALFGTTAYFANSAGRVVGVDVTNVGSGVAPIVFDYWMGDDVDATIVIDKEGMLYVSAEVDLRTARAGEVGQVAKLDPTKEDPLVWSLQLPGTVGLEGGVWATPALAGDTLYVVTNPGELLAVDTGSGDILWRDDIGGSAWSSPVYVDDTVIVAVDCMELVPALRAYDVSQPLSPAIRWQLPLETGCIESTPAVWDGRLYVGSRNGFFFAFGDA